MPTPDAGGLRARNNTDSEHVHAAPSVAEHAPSMMSRALRPPASTLAAAPWRAGPPLRALLLAVLVSAMVLGCGAAAAARAAGPAAPMPRLQALRTLDHGSASQRAAAVARLADVGTMADAPRLAARLRDEDADVRDLAGAALWMVWSRSGDRSVDRLFNRGVRQLGLGELQAAQATFTQVIRRKPGFAEGWNKRATVRFMLGDDQASLKDSEEALRRNPLHFGALAGMAQIHWRRGDLDLALQAYERALQVNPNLDGGPEVLDRLEEAVRRQGGERT